jgi:hypothetical protein
MPVASSSFFGTRAVNARAFAAPNAFPPFGGRTMPAVANNAASALSFFRSQSTPQQYYGGYPQQYYGGYRASSYGRPSGAYAQPQSFSAYPFSGYRQPRYSAYASAAGMAGLRGG